MTQHGRIPLSQERIVEQALALIDRGGAAALTVERLGAELGVSDMALYKHFASKGAIVDAVLERLLGSVRPLQPGEEAGGGLAGFYRALWQLLRAHPRAVPLLLSRPLALPALRRATEENLGALRAGGWGEAESSLAVHALTALTLGLAGLAAGGLTEPWAALPPWPDGLAAGAADEGGEARLDEYFDHALTLLLAAVAARPGGGSPGGPLAGLAAGPAAGSDPPAGG